MPDDPLKNIQAVLSYHAGSSHNAELKVKYQDLLYLVQEVERTRKVLKKDGAIHTALLALVGCGTIEDNSELVNAGLLAEKIRRTITREIVEH